ncbi:hypothetical protein ACOWN8_00670 [Helicobacter pylori]
MLTHTIAINATHNMILLPILKPLDKTQPYHDEFFAHLRQNFKPHYSIISINQKLNRIKKKRSIILIKNHFKVVFALLGYATAKNYGKEE